ncbi:hypothetical protein Lesp02_12010 [Lentzea sp. NBRC 105346]|uniref:hypothetical protein n=1 Tax=Lentzea sp. NBRC 105346 TaxID=3032205 RepID=UPI0024A2C108|nr:hypothetical protein [Lentzea sp. NBRC 105346]GLZ29011.1 hypothetical protein Lesp02_12010 [Lentzea sp. NBRC 105346]
MEWISKPKGVVAMAGNYATKRTDYSALTCAFEEAPATCRTFRGFPNIALLWDGMSNYFFMFGVPKDTGAPVDYLAGSSLWC